MSLTSLLHDLWYRNIASRASSLTALLSAALSELLLAKKIQVSKPTHPVPSQASESWANQHGAFDDQKDTCEPVPTDLQSGAQTLSSGLARGSGLSKTRYYEPLLGQSQMCSD